MSTANLFCLAKDTLKYWNTNTGLGELIGHCVHTCAGMGGVGSNPPDDPVKPPATALAGAAN